MRRAVSTAVRSLLVVLVASLTMAGPHAAWAQSKARTNVTSYNKAYFAGAQPASALDMVTLVPGFRLVEGDALVRGYSGAVGNVVIDGQPPASKQDKLEDILKRIPADQVERIEIVRPGAADMDMQGYPLIANVVRKTNNAPRIRVEAEVMRFKYGTLAPKIAAEISIGSTYVLDLSVAAYRILGEDGLGFGRRDRIRPDGTATVLSHYEQPKYDEIWTVMAGYRQPLLGGKVNLRALYKDDRGIDYILEQRSFPAAVTFNGGDKEFKPAMEFNLEYDRNLWKSAENQFIVIRRDRREKNLQFSDQGGPLISALKDAHWSETVLRDMVRQRSKHFTLEAGAEGAINTVNNKNSLTSNGVPVFLPAGNVQIKETRAEFFGNLITSFNSRLSLETGARYEMSEFTQRGDSNLNKSLAYLKPRALLTWQPTKNDEVRLLFEREAGQLDFTNFIAFIQVSTSSVTSGNKNQVPATQWRKEAAWEHRFGNSGSIVVTGRREEISDVLDRIALTQAGTTYDAPGNIGSGWREELQMDMILPLDWTGVPGFTLQGTGLYRVSGVTDPTNGMRRRISNDAPEEGKLSLTHDIPAWNLRWGAIYKHDVEKNQFRYNEIRGNHLYTRFDAFVEYKPSPDWLIRLIGRNMIDTPDYKARTLYVGGGVRGVAPVNYVEQLPLTYGPGFGINIQKTFGG